MVHIDIYELSSVRGKEYYKNGKLKKNLLY